MAWCRVVGLLGRYVTTERFKVPEYVIVRCSAVVEFALLEVFLFVAPEVLNYGFQ